MDLRLPVFAGGAKGRGAGILCLVALGILVSMFIAALCDVSRAWDVWYYHLPFAARIAGILPRESFVYHPLDEARFQGFPLLCETLQGLLWRITHRIECANLVAFFAVPVVGLFLRARFGVPVPMTVLGLLAVPLVQIHSTSCYVDLPANGAAAMLVLLTFQACASPRTPSKSAIAGAFIAAAFAANSKVLLQPIVLVSLGVFCLRVLWTIPRAQVLRMLLVMIVLLPIVLVTPLKNLALHHNPYYPIRFSIGGLVFDGPETPYSSTPLWLQHAPRPVRFIASIFEIGARPLSNSRRWTIDQWAPSDARDFRMGGFFGAYVAAQLIMLVVQVLAARSREARVFAAGFVVFTAMIAMMPQSHELRYYMCWMIVLVSVNLALAVSDPLRRGTAVNLVSVAALAVVLWVTRSGYIYPSGSTFAELVREQTNAAKIASVPEYGTACVARAPFNLLWAAPFHAPRHYTLKEVEQANDCGPLPRF